MFDDCFLEAKTCLVTLVFGLVFVFCAGCRLLQAGLLSECDLITSVSKETVPPLLL